MTDFGGTVTHHRAREIPAPGSLCWQWDTTIDAGGATGSSSTQAVWLVGTSTVHLVTRLGQDWSRYPTGHIDVPGDATPASARAAVRAYLVHLNDGNTDA